MSESSPRIEVVSPFQPAGDQPEAIDTLVEGLGRTVTDPARCLRFWQNLFDCQCHIGCGAGSYHGANKTGGLYGEFKEFSE